jgi:hypothetical protein
MAAPSSSMEERKIFSLPLIQLSPEDRIAFKITTSVEAPVLWVKFSTSICPDYLKILGFQNGNVITIIGFITREQLLCWAYYDRLVGSYYSFTGRVLLRFDDSRDGRNVSVIMTEKSAEVVITCDQGVDWSEKKTVAIDAVPGIKGNGCYGQAHRNDDGIIKMTLVDVSCSTPHALCCECIPTEDGLFRLHLSKRRVTVVSLGS